MGIPVICRKGKLPKLEKQLRQNNNSLNHAANCEIFYKNISHTKYLAKYSKLQLDKFESADFKYDNSFSKLLPKTSKRGNFGPKFRNFFWTKLCS